MTFILRPARADDVEALYAMAKSTGGGFTNLPPDRPSLSAKLTRAAASFARVEDVLGDDLFVFMLEDEASGRIRGTCQVFSQVGVHGPFYSYRISTITQTSKELARTFRADMLTLTTDLEGASEVGGLYLHPLERSGGAGALLARARYLFIRAHRARFADCMLAELRGSIDETGNSAFWDGLAGRFFGMSFREADEFNAVHGNQFIADLMPKHPIYTSMLPETAQSVIGVPHISGRAAMRMLEKEGFRYERYVDIFDGGPTVTCPTDQILTVRDARDAPVVAIGGEDMPEGAVISFVSVGRLAGFRATVGCVLAGPEGVTVPAGVARRLGIGVGDVVSHVAR